MGIDFTAHGKGDQDLIDIVCAALNVPLDARQKFTHVSNAVQIMAGFSTSKIPFDVRCEIEYHMWNADYAYCEGWVARLHSMFESQSKFCNTLQLGNARVLRNAIAHYHPELCDGGFPDCGETSDPRAILEILRFALGWEEGDAIAPHINRISWS